jgi:hypothetical protein
MFNFGLDDLITRHPSHAALVQSFHNSITAFFGYHRSLDAVTGFITRPFLSALESPANRLVDNGPKTWSWTIGCFQMCFGFIS